MKYQLKIKEAKFDQEGYNELVETIESLEKNLEEQTLLSDKFKHLFKRLADQNVLIDSRCLDHNELLISVKQFSTQGEHEVRVRPRI